MAAPLSWTRLVALLEEHHPEIARPVSSDPFELVLWEQVAYLASDVVRAAAFKELRKRTSLDPQRILALPLKELETIARSGGSIAWRERAQRMRNSSEQAATLSELGKLNVAEARRRLKKFAMIGGPGADRILLHAQLFPVFGLESNGLRVLMRLGFGTPAKDYAGTYRSVLAALDALLPADIDRLSRAERTLRAHGLLICTRSAPRCGTCSLLPYCRFGKEQKNTKERARGRPG
ncbi:MAG: hypothetical protein KA791_15255 [Flavobacteriales bacterium]|nr:hypothetical protein [Flavobacteriales bacterium]